MRILIIACLGLFLAPLAQAQFIDCSGGCTEVTYGLGNDPPEGPFTHTIGRGNTGPGDGSCGGETQPFKFPGQIKLREQNSCVVDASTRCRVETPLIPDASGFFNTNQGSFDFGPLGLVNLIGALFTDMGGNIGHRQLSGICTLDEGQECALDSDCPAGAGCLSSCHSDPGTTCASHADCAAADCRTEIEWDGIGHCTDDVTVCSTDADCSGGDICLAGLEWATSTSSCICCQSSTGTTCAALVGWVEYPALLCGQLASAENHVAAPDWLFDGGRGTRFDMERIQVPNQQEGLCRDNRQRPCGFRGDFWAGAANGKCESGTPACAADPFGDDLAIASTCDDVAFGGAAGDVCDLSEQSIRISLGSLNPDGTQDATGCTGTIVRLVGTPGELCALPVDIPEGDPQPGCALINIGIVAQPDLDCSGVDDTVEGRCMPVDGATCADPADCPSCVDDADCASSNCVNNGDLCPFIGEVNWFLDTNNDDIGDECQCGDGNRDGAITGIDIGAVAICANDPLSNPFCDSTIVDATGDNATTAEDIGGIVAAVNGTIQSQQLSCVRNTDTSQ